jgi:hypothetical protein
MVDKPHGLDHRIGISRCDEIGTRTVNDVVVQGKGSMIRQSADPLAGGSAKRLSATGARDIACQ